MRCIMQWHVSFGIHLNRSQFGIRYYFEIVYKVNIILYRAISLSEYREKRELKEPPPTAHTDPERNQNQFACKLVGLKFCNIHIM